MASFRRINYVTTSVVVVFYLVVVPTSSNVIPQKRDDSLPEATLKANSWIIQAPKRPLPGLSGIGLPPGGMLLMTMDPNATMIEQQQQQSSQPPQQLELLSTTSAEPLIEPQEQPSQPPQPSQQLQQLESSPAPSEATTSAVVTSEHPSTELPVVSSSPTESPGDIYSFTSPSIDDVAVTETLATSTVGTEAVTEASPSSSTREPETNTQEASPVLAETESVNDLVTDVTGAPDLVTTPDTLEVITTEDAIVETTTDSSESTINTESGVEQNNSESIVNSSPSTDNDYWLAYCKGSDKCYYPSTSAPIVNDSIPDDEDNTTENTTTLNENKPSHDDNGSHESNSEMNSATEATESEESQQSEQVPSAAIISLLQPSPETDGSGSIPEEDSGANLVQSNTETEGSGSNPETSSDIHLIQPVAETGASGLDQLGDGTEGSGIVQSGVEAEGSGSNPENSSGINLIQPTTEAEGSGLVQVGDETEGSGIFQSDVETEGSGSNPEKGSGANLVQPVVETEGSGLNPSEDSDAPPDFLPTTDHSDSNSNLIPATDAVPSSSLVEPTGETISEALLVAFSTERVPLDPGLAPELTTTDPRSTDNDNQNTEVLTENDSVSARRRRHLLSLEETKEKNVEQVKEEESDKAALKSEEDIEEARRYRPYPIRPGMRPGDRPPIHRFDQNIHPDYDNIEDSSNVIYRTYDYCYTLWCKFKTSLHRIGLL